MNLQALVERVTSYYPQADVGMIEKAYHYSQRAHQGQLRESGEPYFQHPFEVAMILAELELDVETIVAGLLHDVLEDTEVTRAEMEREFGHSILSLVEGPNLINSLPKPL